ncbi:MAG: reverse transcriptase domain-containing protein [Pirellulaceae bacterium]
MNPIYQTLQGILNRGGDPRQIEQLAEILDIPVADVRTLSEDRRVSYRPFTLKKRGAGRRLIHAPSGYLKRLQRNNLHRHLENLPLHPRACAYRRGRSIVSHARFHLNQQILLSVDLKDFFGRTSVNRVRHFYATLGWRDDALRILVRLSTFQGGLPQGAPTSPALSNLVNFELDTALHELATFNGAQYSRYADDLAFSWSSRTVEPMTFRNSASGVLDRFGYEVQQEKGWQLQNGNQQPELTGIAICGNRLRPRQELRQERSRLRRILFKTKNQMAKLAGLNGFFKQLGRR